MKQFLIDMGANLVFSQDADFSGISTRKGLFISSVIHQAVVEVNERGTEAAAATGLSIAAFSFIRPNRVVDFICDRPFMIIIHDKKTMLFMGKFVQP